MNVTTSTFTLTQMILAWTLLGLLVSWLIIFAALSLRVFVLKNAEREDLPTPSRPLPAISIQPADTQLHYVEVATGDMLPKNTNSDASRDGGTIPIK
jgi:hypothetical protein